MKENTRSELFFLKQFGFSEKLLESIFISGMDPLSIIFGDDISLKQDFNNYITNKDKTLSVDINKYTEFKEKLYKTEVFLKKDEKNKIYFKYDNNELTNLLPEKIMPLFMYAMGNFSLLDKNRKRVAIVGTRKPNKETVAITRKLTEKFVSDGYTVVSGLAEGVDTISHEEALKLCGNTIAILPSNLKNIYPKKNEALADEILKDGLLLTAIGPKEHTYKSSFLDRNQYVANISNVILVTETNLKSGTMNTIRHAGEANKKILFIDQKDKSINDKIYKYGGEMINE